LHEFRCALISARGTAAPHAGQPSSCRAILAPHCAVCMPRECGKKSLPHVGHGVEGGGIGRRLIGVGGPKPPQPSYQDTLGCVLWLSRYQVLYCTCKILY
jgi:hypothetical protein